MMTMTDEQALIAEEALSTIDAWRQQEQKYACHDYLRMHALNNPSLTLKADRKLMLKWSYNVVDYFNLSRETAAISMNYSDRFMQTDRGPEFLTDTDKYQLLCIAALYLAVKVHETASLAPKVFVEIGRGHYTENQIEEMEVAILNALEWRLNPPTALGFVRLFLDLIPERDLDHGMKATVYMLSRVQTERAVEDYKVLMVEASKIASASLQNSLDALGYNYYGKHGNILDSTAASLSTGFASSEEFADVRVRLSNSITFSTNVMNLAPNLASKQTSNKKRTNSNNTSLLQKSTTPRSVLCDITN